jgi:NitT/TauT family transport system substrate-binding protein
MRPQGRTPFAWLRGGVALLGAALLLGAQAPARAAETLRVGKAVGVAFSFVPLDIGIRKGLFAQNGLEIESTTFAGDARMQQAMAADSIDIALGSGPAMAFIVKGAPIKGIAYWLVSETSRLQGWGPNGINIAPLGAPQAQYVALERRDTDAMVADISSAFDMEKNGKARILLRFGDLVKDFHIHVIFATNKAVASRPETLRAFLKGWFATIAFMRANKAATVAIAMDVMNKDEAIISRSYDELMPMFSDDGKFDPKALATLAKSYVELGVLPQEPDMSKLYTESFLPKNE